MLLYKSCYRVTGVGRASYITEAFTGSGYWYSDKTDHGQNGPDQTDHVSGQNGPRLRTKRTTVQGKTDQASGQIGPGFLTKRALF